jgi:CubicO group peptidase (beta-lactamase class C family)
MVGLASADNANEFAMTLMPAYAPDERWYYSSGDTQLLSAVLESITGMSARDYAQDRLFSRRASATSQNGCSFVFG